MKPVNTIEVLQTGLRAQSVRQAVIANNIANIGTPGYRRREVRFEDALAKAIEGGQSLSNLQPSITVTNDGAADDTGNDVNLDLEVGELVKTAGAYKTYMRLLQRTYRQMDLAIRGDAI